MKRIYILFIFLLSNQVLWAQEHLTQTIRGRIVDKQSRYPLIGANVSVSGTSPLLGASTDVDGRFVIEEVPIGRHQLLITSLGYQPLVINNLQLNSAKELVLTLEMEESITELADLVIEAERRKDQPLNQMASVSARSFTTDESNRYAGSLGDPARMASNFAGVSPMSQERNDIVIRGNSPMGLLWRLDGIEIPNPNHFGSLGSTGGPVTILNNNLLTNSDFMTSAFPAAFGNAVSGVFDLNMREGNANTHEFWGQVGFNGVEAGAEGPLHRASNASYLVTYRYSVLDLVNRMGLDTGIQPEYQDLTFKLKLPTKKYGEFSLFGIGGLSYIEILESEEERSGHFVRAKEDVRNGSDLGIFGFSHLYQLDEKRNLKSTLSLYGTKITTQLDTFTIDHPDPAAYYREISKESRLSFSTAYSHKFDARNHLEAGFRYDQYFVHYTDSVMRGGGFMPLTDMAESLGNWQGFVQAQHFFSDELKTYGGLHVQYFPYNERYFIEPRLGVKWQFSPRQAFTVGYGLHSQLPPRILYFVQTGLPQEGVTYTNRELDYYKSSQWVIGYDLAATEDFRIKAEGYYQHLFDVPVTSDPSAYSLLNAGADFHLNRVDSLVNRGTGKNYGLELTLEKFFSQQYYFLVTGSVYNSKYRGSDGVQRNTAFNGNYMLNALGGYEWKINDRFALTFDLKTSWAGGKRYIPVNEAASREKGQVIMASDRSYELKYDDYFVTNLRIGFKQNSGKVYQELAVDLQNLFNTRNIFSRQFDPASGEYVNSYQQGFFPMTTWRIQF